MMRTAFAVVPAKAGTHEHKRIDGSVFMGRPALASLGRDDRLRCVRDRQ